MKLKGHSPVDLIINNRKLIEKIYIVLIIFSLICVPMVGINYDLTKYLPDSSPSAQALDIMEDEFTYPGMGRVMLEDVTLYEAKNIKDRIADVDGVDMVMWCDMATNIYGSSEFINYDNTRITPPIWMLSSPTRTRPTRPTRQCMRLKTSSVTKVW